MDRTILFALLGCAALFAVADAATKPALCAKEFTICEDQSLDGTFSQLDPLYTNGTTFAYKAPFYLEKDFEAKTKAAGFGFGTCTAWNVFNVTAVLTSQEAETICLLSFTFNEPIGMITAAGPLTDVTGESTKVAITGGTGAFNSASGVVTVTVVEASTTYKYSFKLKTKPSC